MKSYPTTRFVFDRKKNATKTKKSLIQVEILLDGKKKYVSTGVKVFKHQWSISRHIISHNDMLDLNNEINAVKRNIDEFIESARSTGRDFSWDELDTYVKSEYKNTESFTDWVARRIEERGDLRESTKKTHRKLPVSLFEYGKIKSFSDLTKANVRNYYDWLQHRTNYNGERISQSTVWSYMKFLRVYVRDAMARDLVRIDPFAGLKVKKGESEPYRWLTIEEVETIEHTEIKNASYSRVRELFLLQCYTGLAYADLMDLGKGKIEEDDGEKYIIGRRLKTGEEYIVLLLPKAEQILEKYNYELPKYSNQQYNKRLKVVASICGIEKPIASHWGRRTAGMLMLNNGVRLEVVSRVLGHSSVKTTETCYASILRKTVVSEMKKMIKN